MSEADMKHLDDIDDLEDLEELEHNDDVEENGEDDLLVKKEDETNVYKENFWPAEADTPKGYTFKGKHKLLTYAVGKSKTLLKKGIEKEINNIKFKVLDNRVIGGATQVTVEMTDKEGRGNGIIDFWGPNKRKECTVLIKKSKEHDERFVKILAKQIIQPMLNCFISGKNISSLFTSDPSKTSAKETKRKKKCNLCIKQFTTKRYLQVHMMKFHSQVNKCGECNFSGKDTHELSVHMTRLDDKMELSSSNENDEENVELGELEKTCFEEKRIDDIVMDTDGNLINEIDVLKDVNKKREKRQN